MSSVKRAMPLQLLLAFCLLLILCACDRGDSQYSELTDSSESQSGIVMETDEDKGEATKDEAESEFIVTESEKPETDEPDTATDNEDDTVGSTEKESETVSTEIEEATTADPEIELPKVDFD
jgi:hypothetical protein